MDVVQLAGVNLRQPGTAMAIWWRIILFGLVAATWAIVARLQLAPAWSFVCIVGGPLAVYPVVWTARGLLDREPTPANAAFVTTLLHAALLALYGTAIMKALIMFRDWHGWTIPLPPTIADTILVVTSVAMSLTVVNLALDASGAPFAAALSRRLATDRLYRFTRNPMVLSVMLWFVAIGLALQSASFVFWTLFVLMPAELEYLLVYEERELEIRFGKDYLAYKSKTPFLWPRLPPRPQAETVDRRVKETA